MEDLDIKARGNRPSRVYFDVPPQSSLGAIDAGVPGRSIGPLEACPIVTWVPSMYLVRQGSPARPACHTFYYGKSFLPIETYCRIEPLLPSFLPSPSMPSRQDKRSDQNVCLFSPPSWLVGWAPLTVTCSCREQSVNRCQCGYIKGVSPHLDQLFPFLSHTRTHTSTFFSSFQPSHTSHTT